MHDMRSSLIKREIKVPKWLWILLALPATLIVGAAAILLSFYISFKLNPLNAPEDIIADRLEAMPRDKQSDYIASVLSDRGPHAGDSLGQSNLLSALEYAQRHDIRLTYDMNLVFPYTGDYFTKKYDDPIYESPTPSIAMRILLHSGRSEIVNSAFESFHSGGGDMSVYSCALEASTPSSDKIYLLAYAKYCLSPKPSSEAK